jgi:hypothetical protein
MKSGYLPYSIPNLDDKGNYFYNTFIQIFQTGLPLKIMKLEKVRKEWLPNGIRISCKCKREINIHS